MGRSLGPLFALSLVITVAAAAQQGAPGASTPADSSPKTVLHTGIQLVIVDVVVEDRNGHPVHGLTQNSFSLIEQNKPETIRNFEEHSSADAIQPGPQLPPMGPGVFTDYTPVPPNGTLNVLLLDALNTPMSDQMFVRQQLLDYVKHEKPGTRVAIFGLNSRLYMLQGFTSDPQMLKDAVEHRIGARSSALLDDPAGSGTEPEKLSDLTSAMPQSAAAQQAAAAQPATSGGVMQADAALQQFEAQRKAFQTQLRVEYTLDAFNALGHYLANFPGRKNLIWFSGAFPLDILPDPSLNSPFNVMEANNDEFRETTNLLARAQVSVYPVDARGLKVQPMFNAANSGKNYGSNPNAFNKDLAQFSSDQAAEHATMDVMAGDTGGRAFYNTNGLADAVTKAIDAGSNYYTLTYSPTDSNWNGAYRKIHVKLAGSANAPGLHLFYRQGYFADDPDHPAKHATPATTSEPSATSLVDHAAEAYSQAALSRGAPAPADILFKVRVLPSSGVSEDKVAPDNVPDTTGKMQAPYRRYAVDYMAATSDFTLAPQPDGYRKGQIAFTVFVYDPDGNLLNETGKALALNISPETYKRLGPGVRFHLEVSAPVRQPSFLRIIVHDVPTNRYGVVEIPTAQVSQLPPLAQPAAAPAASADSGAKR